MFPSRSQSILGAVALVLAITTAIFFSRARAMERDALVKAGIAQEALKNEAEHHRKANEARAKADALEGALAAARGESEKWRKVAAAMKVPDGPITPPVDSAAAVVELRSVGLASAQEDPFGVAINLADSGQVFRWGTAFPILLNKTIAQEGLIAGLDSQVGLLGQQKALLGTENQELRAGNEDLRVAATSYKSAFESTDKALRFEKRWGTVKVGGAVVLAGYAGYRLGKR